MKEMAMTEMKGFSVSYDAKADVLYIAKRLAQASKGREDSVGIVWRYDGEGQLIGATVMDFHDHWSEHRHALAMKISDGFHISPIHAEVVVDQAFAL